MANVTLGWPVAASPLAAFVVAGLVGLATDELILKPFRASGFITTAILNVPIRHAGRRLGTINLCGEEGMYGPAEIARGKILAGLLVPALLMMAD